MKSLIVLFCAAAAQSAVILPYGAGLHYAAAPAIASTLKFKTAALEPVDAATPADTQKIELVEKEHEQVVYSSALPAVTYAAAHAALPAATYAALPAAVHALPATYGYGLPTYALGLGNTLAGVPFAIPAPVEAAAEAEEPAAAEEPAVMAE